MKLTYDEIVSKCDEAMMARRDFGEIAAHVSLGRQAVKNYWLTDRGLVDDLFVATGDIEMSDAVLTILSALAAGSPSINAVVSRLKNDPQGINFGDAGFRMQIVAMTPAYFNEEQSTALLNLALRADPVNVYDVSVAMEGH